MLRKIPIKEVRPSALLYVSAVIGFFAIVMLFSFHDDVTEVSFFGSSIYILTDEFELRSPNRQNFWLSIWGSNLFLNVYHWMKESDFE